MGGTVSIRARLSFWYGSALALSLVLFAALLYGVMARDLREQIDRSLEQAAAVAVQALELHGVGPTLPFEDLAAEFPELAVLDKFFQIFSPAGRVTIQSPNVRRHEIPLSRAALEAALAGQATLESARFKGESPIRILSVPIRRGGLLVNIVQVGTSLHPVDHTLRRMLEVFLIAAPFALLVALAGGWFLAGRALRPVEAITEAAERIAGGDLSQRLTIPPSQDEIGRLVATFNKMIARLDASFQQVRRFSADASHELRTPLTVMRGETELALRRPRSAEDYRIVLESSLEEIGRLSRIVDDLLFLSRADLGQVPVQSAPVRLDTLLQDIQQQASVLGQDRQIQVTAGPLEPVTVLGDELRLRELLLNLVDNAVAYSRQGGTVELRLTQDRTEARLTVADSGIGIPPEEQARIFDRFYRTDTARAHSKKGTGLGLAICQWIVESHKGRIEVESTVGKGSRFTVILPLAPAPIH
ncbi:MAG: HAMP domain-containing protein [Nitrospirae bacterium]|nr:MAG: HAMP domain-containing protein [Nitrospirota bacterium]